METLSELLAICAGNSPVTGEFHAHSPVTRSLKFSLICAWINGWVNNRETGDLRRHRVHYAVTVMGIIKGGWMDQWMDGWDFLTYTPLQIFAGLRPRQAPVLI